MVLLKFVEGRSGDELKFVDEGYVEWVAEGEACGSACFAVPCVAEGDREGTEGLGFCEAWSKEFGFEVCLYCGHFVFGCCFGDGLDLVEGGEVRGWVHAWGKAEAEEEGEGFFVFGHLNDGSCAVAKGDWVEGDVLVGIGGCGGVC